MLVTNLANRVQPLIRTTWATGCSWLPAPCACGSPFPVLRVEGRSGDVLSFAAADGAALDGAALDGAVLEGVARDGAALDGKVVTVLPLALGTVIEETAGVRRFQAIRTGPRSLTVRLELWPDAGTAPCGRRWGSAWVRSSRPRAPTASTSGLPRSRPGRTAAASSGEVWSA